VPIVPISPFPLYLLTLISLPLIYKQQVQEAEGKQLAADFGAVFYETSAKSSSSIEELFVTLGEHMLYCTVLYCFELSVLDVVLCV